MAVVESSVASKPTFTWAEVAPVAARYGAYEFAGSLPSERDQNFLVRHASGELAVFKIHNPSDDAAFIDCQSLALDAAHLAGARCQQLLLATDGSRHVLLGACHCRMLSWLPGQMLADAAAAPETIRADLWAAVGRAVGGLSAALATFQHPATQREFVWDLRRCGEVIAAHVGDLEPHRRPLLEAVAGGYKDSLEPLLPQLRQGVVHNDPNDYNLVVEETGRVGVLDFGDMVWSYRCADAAICSAYLLLHCQEGEPLAESLVPFVRSFHACCPLELAEAEALFGLAVLRLCTSVCMSAYQSRLEPENEYLLVSAVPAWRVLERLGAAEGSGQKAAELMRSACGFACGGVDA